MQYHIEYYPVEHVSFGKNADGISVENLYQGWNIGEAWIPVPVDVVTKETYEDGTIYYTVDVQRGSPEIAFIAASRMFQEYITNKEISSDI